jgi:hypothetical protein
LPLEHGSELFLSLVIQGGLLLPVADLLKLRQPKATK